MVKNIDNSTIMSSNLRPLANCTIPQTVLNMCLKLNQNGHEAYLVGGCVRDLILGKTPKDWDVTTDADPTEIQAIFDKTFYENSYGTVGVVTEGESDETLKVIEITPYRIESDYTDNRHPASVSFSTNIHDDLKRRDFTCNAIAYDPVSETLIDDFDGIKDISHSVLRTVGNASDRFKEDGLRILRAIRLASTLGFTISSDTEQALIEKAFILEHIAKERIKDEFVKMIMDPSGATSIFLLQRLGLLKYVIPELEEGVEMGQNQAHSYTVFEHLIRSMQCAIDKNLSLEMRLSALLHDVGKPASRRFAPEKGDYTFYGHEVIGARMTKKILERLKFSRETIDMVTTLVRWHMFFSDTGQITLSAVRRMIANVGKDRIWDLIDLRICDRVGTGRPKEDPYRLRKYISMIEEVLRDPVSVSMLKIDGSIMIQELGIQPGPMIGFMLNILLGEVIENPSLNTKEYLVSRVTELQTLDMTVLKQQSEQAVRIKNMVEEGELQEIRKKHRV